MRIIIVRHGHPDYAMDCLTPLGHLQAKAAAERLKDEGIEEIYTSPMGRARQTAEYTADLLGIREMKVLDFAHEISWSSRDGRPIFEDGHPWTISDTIVAENRSLSDKDWRTHPYFSNNTAVDQNAYVSEETDRWLEGLGLKREGLYYRNCREDDWQHTIALFCHGGSSSVMFSRIFNLEFPFICATFHIDFTGITILRFDRKPGSLTIPIFELLNDARHIRGIESPV